MDEFSKSLNEFLKKITREILKPYLKHQEDINYYYYQCRPYKDHVMTEILHDINDTQHAEIIENYKFEPPLTALGPPGTIFSYIVTENGILYIAKVQNSFEIGAKHYELKTKFKSNIIL